MQLHVFVVAHMWMYTRAMRMQNASTLQALDTDHADIRPLLINDIDIDSIMTRVALSALLKTESSAILLRCFFLWLQVWM